MQQIGTVSGRPGSVTELERLFEMTRDVLEAPTLDAALTSLAGGVQELFGWRFVSMVAAEEPNGNLRRIVRLLVGLGEACGLRVTAEGIETAAQAKALLSLGCKSGQGMYFHAPLPAEDISALLR
jgi:hypothetical protein